MFNRYLISILFIFIAFGHVYAETSEKCPGQEGYYFTNFKRRNPKQGGFVSYDAVVNESGDTVYIGPNTAVCDYSSVEGDVKIAGKTILKDYASVNGSNIEINGNIVLDGDVSIGSNVTIRGVGKLSTGRYENQTLFLKDAASNNTERIESLFQVNKEMFYNYGPGTDWRTLKVSKFKEVANSRKRGCVYEIELEGYYNNKCSNGRNKFLKKYSFTLDFGKDIDSLYFGHYSKSDYYSVPFHLKESSFNPSFKMYAYCDDANCACGTPVQMKSSYAQHSYVVMGVPLAVFNSEAEQKSWKNKLHKAIDKCQ